MSLYKRGFYFLVALTVAATGITTFLAVLKYTNKMDGGEAFPALSECSGLIILKTIQYQKHNNILIHFFFIYIHFFTIN